MRTTQTFRLFICSGRSTSYGRVAITLEMLTSLLSAILPQKGSYIYVCNSDRGFVPAPHDKFIFRSCWL